MCRNFRVLKEVWVEKHNNEVRVQTGSGNMAVSCRLDPYTEVLNWRLLFKINLCFFAQEVNKPSSLPVTVFEVKGYGFSDFWGPP